MYTIHGGLYPAPCLYVDGFKTDGHKYIQSLDNGAAAFLVKGRTCLEGMTVLKVRIPVMLLPMYRQLFECPFEHFELIGITGTKGRNHNNIHDKIHP